MTERRRDPVEPIDWSPGAREGGSGALSPRGCHLVLDCAQTSGRLPTSLLAVRGG